MAEVPLRLSEEDLAVEVLNAGAVTIRDIAGGEKPFLYSSGNYGPGYVSIKGLCGWQEVFKTLTKQCALNLIEQDASFDFVAANATGGMAPGYQVREDYQELTGKKVPYIYVRNTRKLGGHEEYATGLKDNPHIAPGDKPLVFEELVNFAQTTCNSKVVLQELGHTASHAGTILTYDNPVAIEQLQKENLILVPLMRLRTVLDVARDIKMFPAHAIDDYREFLENPAKWQESRGYKKIDLGK